MLNLADSQKLRFIPVVFLYMERDNFFFISILLIKRQAPMIIQFGAENVWIY